MGWGRGFVGLTCCALTLGTPGVASAGETGAPPAAGSTFRATAELVTVKLTALAPDAKGGIQLRGTVAVACGRRRLAAGLEEAVSGRVARDGTYDIDATLVGPAEGIQTRGTVRLRGAFTDAGATAKINYDLTETDDRDEVIDECSRGPIPLDVAAGPVDPGVALVTAAIPVVKESDPHYQGATATSSSHVFVAIRKSEFDLDRLTTVLVRIDPTNNRIEKRRTVDHDLWALATVGDELFGIDANGGNVVPIDAGTLRAGAPVNIARGTDGGQLVRDHAPLWPSAVGADGALWLSASQDREIVRFDPTAGKVAGRIPLERTPTELAAGPAGVYAATFGETENFKNDGAVVRVDPATMSVAATADGFTSLDTVVADETQVVAANQDPDSSRIVQLDPSTLAVVLARDGTHPGLLAAAPPGIWGDDGPTGKIVGLDRTLTDAASVIEVDTGTVKAAPPGFDAIWIYDEELRLVYRIATF